MEVQLTVGLSMLIAIVSGLVSASFAAGGAWLATRTELRYQRRDIDANSEEIKAAHDRHRQDMDVVHKRINDLGQRIPS